MATGRYRTDLSSFSPSCFDAVAIATVLLYVPFCAAPAGAIYRVALNRLVRGQHLLSGHLWDLMMAAHERDSLVWPVSTLGV